MPFDKHAGRLVVATVLLGVIGCNQGTEIPLAKVAPVTIKPQPPAKAPTGTSISPVNLGP